MSKKKPARDQNRRTPPWLFAKLQKYLGLKFKLDAAASAVNALCKKFLTEADNGLAKPWIDGTFCNPPFKRFGLWLAKALLEARERKIVVCVIGPMGGAQTWFHGVAKCGTILVPNSRLVFYDSVTGKPTAGADRDSAIYVFGPGWWNENSDTWQMKTFEVQGEVITSRNAP